MRCILRSLVFQAHHGQIIKLFGVADDWYSNESEAISQLQTDGVITFDNGQLALTAAGQPLARVVAAVFDTYLRNSSVRHSIAV